MLFRSLWTSKYKRFVGEEHCTTHDTAARGICAEIDIDMERRFSDRSLTNVLLRKVMVERKADTKGLITSKVIANRMVFIRYQLQQS